LSDARYIDARGVADYLSISRNMVDILVRDGKLPPPISLTKKLKRWDREAIDAALAGKPAELHHGRAASDIIRGVADGLAKGRSTGPKTAQGR
jgi:predicted DNA-binding transcriptional regulator AlpA